EVVCRLCQVRSVRRLLEHGLPTTVFRLANADECFSKVGSRQPIGIGPGRFCFALAEAKPEGQRRHLPPSSSQRAKAAAADLQAGTTSLTLGAELADLQVNAL